MAVDPEAVVHQAFHHLVVAELGAAEGEGGDDGEESLELLLLSAGLHISDEALDLLIFRGLTCLGDASHNRVDGLDAGSGAALKGDCDDALHDGREVGGIVISKWQAQADGVLALDDFLTTWGTA